MKNINCHLLHMAMNSRPIVAVLITTVALWVASTAASNDVFSPPPHKEQVRDSPPVHRDSTNTPISQTLETPFYGQHTGCAFADLNGDGAIDLLFAAGRHWVDQSYALINLGPEYDDEHEFAGVRFSEALPIGPPGAYYQIDVASPSSTDETDDGSTVRHTVLLVGGTCHAEKPNDLGSCEYGDNTPARVVRVSMGKGGAGGGCSIRDPDAECHLEYAEAWEHPNPRGDRNGGFVDLGDRTTIALLGQGGIEIIQSAEMPDAPHDEEDGRDLLHASYVSVFRDPPPEKTDPRSDLSRYAGFAAGNLPTWGGVVFAGRRSDYDPPEKDADGNAIGINKVVYKNGWSSSFRSSTVSSHVSGEPYPGNPEYSIQTTNFALADIDGDGVQDLLEATFLYPSQRVPGYPLPQRVHFVNEHGRVKDTLVLLEDGVDDANHGGGHDGDDDAGRSVTTGQIFSDSSLPDVVFASADGVITLFANLGVDETTGVFRGLELRHRLTLDTDECEIRDVVVAKLAQEHGTSGKCWMGVVCAVTCGLDVLGRNTIFYVEGDGGLCTDANPNNDRPILTEDSLLFEREK